jgi:hypothetical protein
MTPDEGTPLAALFGAAKREAPRAEVRELALERAVAATREPLPARRKSAVVAAGALFALAALIALWVTVETTHRTLMSVTPERVPPLAHTNPTPDLPEPRPAVSGTGEDARTTDPAPARSERPPAPHPAPTLGDELAELEAARSALTAGDPKRALALLDHYRQTTRGARLADEALVLRLDALVRAGRGAEAAALARDFVAKNPGSPLVDRARAFTADPNAAPAAAGGVTTP